MARNFSPEFLAFQKKRKDPLSYPLYYYQYADAVRANIPNPIAEYRKLRTSALNRLRKLEKAGYGDTETVRQARALFAKKPSELTADQTAQRLPDAARFITSARGTVGGMREIERKTAQALQDRGLTFINRKNVQAFTFFLDKLGAKKLETQFYEAVSGAPREGLNAKKKRLKMRELQAAFEAWAKENDFTG